MIDKKTIKDAKYVAGSDGKNSMVSCTINGVGVSVPLDPDNVDYAAILDWVAEGNTIEDAD